MKYDFTNGFDVARWVTDTYVSSREMVKVHARIAQAEAEATTDIPSESDDRTGTEGIEEDP